MARSMAHRSRKESGSLPTSRGGAEAQERPRLEKLCKYNGVMCMLLGVSQSSRKVWGRVNTVIIHVRTLLHRWPSAAVHCSGELEWRAVCSASPGDAECSGKVSCASIILWFFAALSKPVSPVLHVYLQVRTFSITHALAGLSWFSGRVRREVWLSVKPHL